MATTILHKDHAFLLFPADKEEKVFPKHVEINIFHGKECLLKVMLIVEFPVNTSWNILLPNWLCPDRRELNYLVYFKNF